MSFDKVEVRVFSGPDQVQVGSNTEPDLIVMNIGPKGDPGTAATIAVGTTTTGAAGTNASVTNSGTTSAAVFNFTIPQGTTGAAGPNSVTSATTSDGTANLSVATISGGGSGLTGLVSSQITDATSNGNLDKEKVLKTDDQGGLFVTNSFGINASFGTSLTVGDGDSVNGRYDIFANTSHFQWYSASETYGEREFVITTENLTSSGSWAYKYPAASGTFAVTASTTGVPDKLTNGTIAGTLAINSTSYTYGTGAAAAHRTALGLTTLATTSPAANVATFLATPTSANLAAAVTDETGSGSLVFGTSPTLDAPTISGSAAFTSTTRPTSAGTGTPAATSLITATDGDSRYGGPIYDLDGSGSNSETTATTPIKTVVLPVGTYLIEFGRLTASHTDATSRTVSCTINFSGGTATIQDRYVGFQGNQASPGAGVNFAGSGTSMANAGSIGNASPNFGSGSFPFGGRIVVTVQTTLRIFGTCSVTPTNPISYETSGILRKII